MTLAKPDYVTLDAHGRAIEVFCKCCGYKIMGFSAAKNRLAYTIDYCEVKIRMTDGTNHVTNVCRKCLNNLADDKDKLQELHDADMAYLTLPETYINRIVDRVVQVELRQRGLP